MFFAQSSAALQHVKAGTVIALGVAGKTRIREAPDLPTIAEQGLAGFDVTSWYALVAPAGTPQPIVDRLHRAIVATVQQADTREALDKAGAEPLTSTPAELAAMIRDGVGKYAAVVKAAGVKPE
jgi:tripartite-type tricarboxylate transporter receptor subunit TctC